MRTLVLQWPSEVDQGAVQSAHRMLAAVAGTPLMLEARSLRHGLVEHRLHVGEARAAAVTNQLRTVISGVGIEGSTEQPVDYTHAVELRLSNRYRPLLAAEVVAIGRAVLTALARVGRDERLSLQWWLLGAIKPTPVASKSPISTASWTESLLQAPFHPPATIDSEKRTALRNKRSEPGWMVAGRIAVRAASDARARQLVTGVADALRISEAPGVVLTTRRTRRPNAMPKRATVRMNLSELSAVTAFPTGTTSELPVLRLGSRRLPASSVIARTGRIIGVSTWPGKPRPLALSAEDSTRHQLLLGPTGTGKSSGALHLIAADLAAGRSCVVVEPGSDLVNAVLGIVPPHRRDEIVLLDPVADDGLAVSINPLAGPPETAELRADQVLGTLHGLSGTAFGIRTADVVHTALLTLARIPGMTLAAVPPLLTDPQFRRRIIGSIDDPLGIGPAWAEFERWTEAERAVAVAPVLRRLRPFLTRARLRHIIGQANPTFSFADVFSKPRIVLVNLARGELGPEAADLLGALVLSSLWQHAQGRAARPVEQRPLVSVTLDEFPTFLQLGAVDLGDALARSRALGVGFTLIAQHLGQMDERMRAAVESNARSLVAFQLSPKDASVMASRSTILGAEDFTGLEPFHFYARLVAGGSVQPWCSGRTLPPLEPINDPAEVRRHARQRYAVPTEQIDAELRALFQPPTVEGKPGTDFGPKRRKGGPS